MAEGDAASAPRVNRRITRVGLFALSFGSIVGSAWVVVLGEWLRAAGPAGAALGFAIGGIAMLAIAACYGELVARVPRVGGEFTYVLETLGRLPAFLTGWFLTLNFVSFAAFEGIALARLLKSLLPMLEGPTIYVVLGEPVSLASLSIGLGGVLFFAGLNLAGTSRAVAFQTLVTLGFILFAIVLVALGFGLGDAAHLRPAFAAESGHWALGSLWIFSTSALFLNGFQAAAYAVEERAASLPLRTVARAMLLAVLAAAIFYIAILFATGFAAPWRASAAAPLPAVAAFQSIQGLAWIGPVILIAAAASLLKTWNALVIVGSRLLVAQARAGFLPAALGRASRNGTPVAAVAFFSVASSAGVMIGLGGLVPILNTCAVCVALSYSLVVFVLIRRRRQGGPRPEVSVRGGAATIGVALVAAVVMGLTAALEPLFRAPGDGIPLEWILLCAWAAIGYTLLRLTGGRAP